MGLKTDRNYPLLRELQEMGLIVSNALAGPFRLKFETFEGKNIGGTQALSQTPVTNGVAGVVALGEGSNDTTNLVETTDYTISGATFTFVTDQRSQDIMITYSY